MIAHPRRTRNRIAASAAFAMLAAAALDLTSCGRGPVEQLGAATTAGTITFELFVQGQITPSQGDYILTINSDIDANTSVNPNESPGEPTIFEAQSGSYTHWDQVFAYGTTPILNGALNPALQPNGFLYVYKALTSSTGSNVAKFVPITLTANQYNFIPNASNGAGTGNVLSIRLPIDQLSIRSNTQASNPPTVSTPAATQLFINFVTTDTNAVPQDQLACQTGQQIVPIDLTTARTYLSELNKPASGCAAPSNPSNPNLYIVGGEIIVNPSTGP